MHHTNTLKGAGFGACVDITKINMQYNKQNYIALCKDLKKYKDGFVYAIKYGEGMRGDKRAANQDLVVAVTFDPTTNQEPAMEIFLKDWRLQKNISGRDSEYYRIETFEKMFDYVRHLECTGQAENVLCRKDVIAEIRNLYEIGIVKPKRSDDVSKKKRKKRERRQIEIEFKKGRVDTI